MLWLYGLQFLVLESLGHCCSLFDNPLLGLMQFMNVWFMAFLFSGIAVPVANVIWPFRVLCYILPYRWAMAACNNVAFIFSPDYGGACPCVPATAPGLFGLAVSPSQYPSLSQECTAIFNQISAGPSSVPVAGMYLNEGSSLVFPYCNAERLDDSGYGFFCPDYPPAGCFGRTGAQVLNSISKSFDAIGPDVDWPAYGLFLIAISVVLKIVHSIGFIVQCRRSEEPVSPLGAATKRGRARVGATPIVTESAIVEHVELGLSAA